MNLSSIKPNFSATNTANTLVQRNAGGDIFVGDITATSVTATTTFTGKLAPAVFTSETALTDVADSDLVLVYDSSTQTTKKVTINDLMRKINNSPYLEYAWVTAPNAAGQVLPDNEFTTLTINTEVYDTGNNGSISGNRITLAAGVYSFDVATMHGHYNPDMIIFYIYNVTTGAYLSKFKHGATYDGVLSFFGQFTLAASSQIELRAMSRQSSGVIGTNHNNNGNFTNSTAGADQRTTIKLWKLS